MSVTSCEFPLFDNHSRMSEPASATSHAAPSDAASYTVVARRYRPRSFEELVGQDHISQALAKAIATGRVGHAYLFTGARGVGKTSSARIFAKLLNAPTDASADATDTADVSRAIDAGDDMDVIEIDAASNRGIDEIRELRANVGKRPSRSRYKIYIIDEVHMLTTQAFNALLKTLEEPPPHVKFIFCTTDPEKVPITVLSRCQRFDFAPVRPDAIKQRLMEICKAEGFEADDEALALLARRAAGSMRDSQSLLEQVMSFSTGKITTEQVHTLLGTADESRMRELAETLANRDGVTALRLVDKAIAEGTDAGQFAEQMLGYLRDLMATAVGGGPDLLKVCNPSNFDQVKQLAERWGLQTILAAVQLLDESLVRMRFSVQSQALFEVALIQISQLQDLATIAKIVDAIQHGSPLPAVPATRTATSSTEKKNVEGLNSARNFAQPQPSAEQSSVPVSESSVQPLTAIAAATTASQSKSLDPPKVQRSVNSAVTIAIHAALPPVANDESVGRASAAPSGYSAQSPEAQAALATWQAAAAKIDGMLGDFAATAVAVECKSSDQWTIVFPPGSAKPVEYCESPNRKAELQSVLDAVVGSVIQFGFRVQPGAAVRVTTEAPVSATVARSQRMRQLAEHPLVSKLCELMQGEVVRVDPPRTEQRPPDGSPSPRGSLTPATLN